ncbi:hypothetical protein B5P42_31365, partial [Bacillus sp. SRB_331]
KFTRKEAIEKHKRNELLPRDPDVEIWTDGSYTKGKKGGAAALIRYKNTNGETANYTEEKSQIKLGRKITSSYEAEIIALHAGLELAIDQRFVNRTIHIMTDSLSWVSQFQSLPIKPRRVYAVVADSARLLAKL